MHLYQSFVCSTIAFYFCQFCTESICDLGVSTIKVVRGLFKNTRPGGTLKGIQITTTELLNEEDLTQKKRLKVSFKNHKKMQKNFTLELWRCNLVIHFNFSALIAAGRMRCIPYYN
jgi:hypothetical protein